MQRSRFVNLGVWQTLQAHWKAGIVKLRECFSSEAEEPFQAGPPRLSTSQIWTFNTIITQDQDSSLKPTLLHLQHRPGCCLHCFVCGLMPAAAQAALSPPPNRPGRSGPPSETATLWPSSLRMRSIHTASRKRAVSAVFQAYSRAEIT